jgi:hypothetical protein
LLGVAFSSRFQLSIYTSRRHAEQLSTCAAGVTAIPNSEAYSPTMRDIDSALAGDPAGPPKERRVTAEHPPDEDPRN